jgi:hypothetical protein
VDVEGATNAGRQTSAGDWCMRRVRGRQGTEWDSRGMDGWPDGGRSLAAAAVVVVN